MKRTAFTALFAIAAMVFSLPGTAQEKKSQTKGETGKNDVILICEDVDKEMIFVDCETQPEFPGGPHSLSYYLKNELHYPKKCRRERIEGRTLVRFTVERNGKVTEAEILKSSGSKQLDKEALKVIKNMPRWQPGMQGDTAVRVKFVMPVKFELKNYTDTKRNDKDIFPIAEIMPSFPGGADALSEFLVNEIRYPKKCLKARRGGCTVISFLVKKDGRLKNIKVQQSCGFKQLDKEAKRVVKKMPKWWPGIHEDKCVNVMYALPIKFDPEQRPTKNSPISTTLIVK